MHVTRSRACPGPGYTLPAARETGLSPGSTRHITARVQHQHIVFRHDKDADAAHHRARSQVTAKGEITEITEKRHGEERSRKSASSQRPVSESVVLLCCTSTHTPFSQPCLLEDGSQGHRRARSGAWRSLGGPQPVRGHCCGMPRQAKARPNDCPHVSATTAMSCGQGRGPQPGGMCHVYTMAAPSQHHVTTSCLPFRGLPMGGGPGTLGSLWHPLAPCHNPYRHTVLIPYRVEGPQRSAAAYTPLKVQSSKSCLVNVVLGNQSWYVCHGHGLPWSGWGPYLACPGRATHATRQTCCCRRSIRRQG